jgi:tetratricopeptide (TPR) repeat protein
VADHPRIEELRRRVQKDPTSLAFAHLAEEYRRAGRFEEAITTCRAGLKVHPTYISAKVTLGRALMEAGDLDAAHTELQAVMSAAPDNLAAIRGLAEIHQRRGEVQEALDYCEWAQEFARQDPDLARQIQNLKAAAALQAPARAAGRVPVEAAAAPAGVPGVAAPTSAPPSQLHAGEDEAVVVPVPGLAQRAGDADLQRRLAFFNRLLDSIVADRERRHASR